jgi:nucleoside-diphosphate-sugar epimerase
MDEILITGASGFVGRRLMERLRGDGRDVRGIDISTDLNRRVVAGDIAEEGPWQAAAEGCDTVVHAAAATTPVATREVRWRTNVLGTRRVLDAAIAAGAKRFVHISTVRAYGDTDFPDGVDESYPVRIDGDAYADTKVAAEQVVLQAHAAGRIAVTIVRPGDVYGPGSRPWTVLPVQLIRRNLFLLPARGDGVFSPVFIDDLADGLLLAAQRPEAAGQIFTLAGGVGVPCREFFGHYYRMLGKRGPLRAPTGLAVGVASVVGRAVALMGGSTEINATSMRYFTRTGTYSIDKARRLLGYRPAVGVDEGMDRTRRWLREQHLVP